MRDTELARPDVVFGLFDLIFFSFFLLKPPQRFCPQSLTFPEYVSPTTESKLQLFVQLPFLNSAARHRNLFLPYSNGKRGQHRCFPLETEE